MTEAIYLTTGANRGVGRGLVEVFLTRPMTTVIAAVRDPNSESSKSLQGLSKGTASQLIVAKIDSRSPADPAAAVQTIQDEHHINRLDVVIANAGICEDRSPVHSAAIEVVKDHVEVNAYGVIYLYQAVYPLLKQSRTPTFIGVGSPLGSTGGMEQRPYSSTAYGASKAMLHWIVRKIHFENEDFVAFVADPGSPQTDLGNRGARRVGMEKAFHTVEESVRGLAGSIDGATRESVGRQWRAWDGSQFSW